MVTKKRSKLRKWLAAFSVRLRRHGTKNIAVFQRLALNLVGTNKTKQSSSAPITRVTALNSCYKFLQLRARVKWIVS